MLAQVKTTDVAAVTVNVAVHVLGASQSDVTVNVTVFDPPHANGAPVLLLAILELQPPLKETVANHAVNFESICA